MTSADFDNQPMVIAESILHGRGVVLVDTNLQEGLSDGAGVWTKDASAQSLADELVALIRHPEKIQSMSQQAAKNRTLFMAKYAVKEQEAIYNEAIQRYAKT
jgi:glycosyltransferase involved in cell wall biosynthesis